MRPAGRIVQPSRRASHRTKTLAAIAMGNISNTRLSIIALPPHSPLSLSFLSPTLVQFCTARRIVPICRHLRALLLWGAQGWPFVAICHDHASPPRLLLRSSATPAPCTSSTRLSAAA